MLGVCPKVWNPFSQKETAHFDGLENPDVHLGGLFLGNVPSGFKFKVGAGNSNPRSMHHLGHRVATAFVR